MLRKWLMVLLSTTMLLPSPKEVNHEPFLLTEVDIKGMEINKLEDKFIVPNIGYDNIKKEIEARENINKIVEERLNRIKEIHEKQLEKERIERESYNIEFCLTFYSRHPSENGGNEVTSTGKPLRNGIVANNYYPINTRIILETGEEYIVADRGSNKIFNNEYRLDVFVDTYDTSKVKKMGKKYVKGKVIYPK